MFSPVIAMLHNTKLNRWHPIIFEEKPLPGPASDDKPVRHKSKGHHTSGFASRDEAVAAARTDLKKRLEADAIGTIKECLAKDFEWDGEGIPAMTVYFVEQAGELLPAMC